MRVFACLGGGVALLATSVNLVLAQAPAASGDQERQYNDAFQEMLAKPADLYERPERFTVLANDSAALKAHIRGQVAAGRAA